VIACPIAGHLLLRKWSNELDKQVFQRKYGSLTEGYKTTGVLGSESTRLMIVWFMLRRLITAVFIVSLADESPVFEISAVMYLSLADVLVGFHLNAFESQTSNNLAKMNDVIVFLLSYFPFIYAGLLPNPEDRYSIGWA
jgi:hypothetical protein